MLRWTGTERANTVTARLPNCSGEGLALVAFAPSVPAPATRPFMPGMIVTRLTTMSAKDATQVNNLGRVLAIFISGSIID